MLTLLCVSRALLCTRAKWSLTTADICSASHELHYAAVALLGTWWIACQHIIVCGMCCSSVVGALSVQSSPCITGVSLHT